MLEMMLPKPHPQPARPVQRRPHRQIRNQSWLQARIKQRKPRRQAAGFGLQAAHQHALDVQAFQVVDGLRRGGVAVLDENAVGGDQAVIVRCGVPAKLFFEGGYGLVVTLDRGDTGQGADECPDTVDQPLRWGEAGLYVDDQEGLAHGLLRERGW